MSFRWRKFGRIVVPNPNVPWLATSTGPACAVPVSGSSLIDIYVAGRDTLNRSMIGRLRVDMNSPLDVLEFSENPVLGCGELGAFDENGVSYPCIVRTDNDWFLYYVGWSPSVLTPFRVNLGLATSVRGEEFTRVSRAPILELTNEDFLSIGSTYVMREGERWRMWYTSFQRWGRNPLEPKHRYSIKYAESNDGISWTRDNQTCIAECHPGEHSISRPSVLRIGRRYHMWYCYRGDEYRIGYAISDDGIQWERQDNKAGIEPSGNSWESSALCYPNVFIFADHLYMLYCGNEYGRHGVGLACRPINHAREAGD